MNHPKWEKVKGAFRHSLVVLWARLVAVSGLLALMAVDLLQDPTVTGALQGLFKPEHVPYVLIAIAIITEGSHHIHCHQQEKAE